MRAVSRAGASPLIYTAEDQDHWSSEKGSYLYKASGTKYVNCISDKARKPGISFLAPALPNVCLWVIASVFINC